MHTSCNNSIFNDVTVTLSLRSVMQVLMGLFTIFQSTGMSGGFMSNIVKSYGQNTVGPLFPRHSGYKINYYITCILPKSVKKLKTTMMHKRSDHVHKLPQKHHQRLEQRPSTVLSVVLRVCQYH